MTRSPFDDRILAAVPGKGLVALLFLRWLVTEPKRTETANTHDRVWQEVA